MQRNPHSSPHNHRKPKPAPHTTRQLFQHGAHSLPAPNNRPILIQLPPESLTHVTANLNPPALLALAQTSRYFNGHVNDDNTWYRAFLYQFLGVLPESDLDEGATLLLRRSESSWRKEFIVRYRIKKRWAYSTSATISHVPHHSPISDMHLMSENGLLCASIQYGVVSRSLPLNGKILKGYMHASGTLNGFGIGNPNAEFSPNVSACALSSEGKSARIAWGFRNGEVAVTTAAKAVDPAARGPASLVRCQVEDQHEVDIKDIAWDAGAFVTADSRGVVKLWDAKRVRCVWTAKQTALIPDPCAKVVLDVVNDVIVAGMKSGAVTVWSAPFFAMLEATDPAVVVEVKIAPPPRTPDPAGPFGVAEEHPVQALFIDPDATTEHVSVLVHHEDDPLFYRLRVNLVDGSAARTTFGEGAFGSIRTLVPSFAHSSREKDFVVVGDHVGTVRVYDWKARPRAPTEAITSIRVLLAHDSAVTAVAFNHSVLLTGSASASVKVWDLLTLEHLRTFASPVNRNESHDVTRLIVENEMFVASVGSRVMAWKAGPVSSPKSGKLKIAGMARTTSSPAPAKWQKQFELKHAIADSRRALEEEHSHRRAVYGREREQRQTLDHLGLSEGEALEYILMLSRDEAAADEGVFVGDFDELDEARAGPTTPPRASHPRAAPSASSGKVQVSPRFVPEPMEAGTSISPIQSFGAGSVPSIGSEGDFPAITPSSSGSSGVGHGRRSFSSGSPGASSSAWAVGSPFARATSGSPESRRSMPALSAGKSLLAATKPKAQNEDEDEELRFVLELSLAEARSRGEVV